MIKEEGFAAEQAFGGFEKSAAFAFLVRGGFDGNFAADGDHRATFSRESFARIEPDARGRCAGTMNDLGLHVMKSETWVEPAFQAFDAARLDDDVALAVEARDESFTAKEAAEDSARHLHLEFQLRFVGHKMA